MIIQTERLILRPFELSDINWYYCFLQQSEVQTYLDGLYTKSFEKAKWDIEIFTKGDFKNDFYYVILDKNTRNIMGLIIAVRLAENMLDVSYFLMKEYRHKGYMHEALEAVVNIAKKANPDYYFRLVIKKQNTSSLNVAKSLKAQIEDRSSKYICYIK